MAARELDLKLLKSGQEYLKSLERLGLRPDGLFWAFDKTVDIFVLVLVTDEYDYAGPLKLSSTLLEAYRKSETPIEIDPFIVRLHSPFHTIIQKIDGLDGIQSVLSMSETLGGPTHDVVLTGPTITSVADLEIRSDWVYRFEKPEKRKTTDLARNWRRFEKNVAKAA